MSYFNYGDTPSVLLNVKRDIIQILSKKYTGRAVKTPVYKQDAADAVNMVENIIDAAKVATQSLVRLKASSKRRENYNSVNRLDAVAAAQAQAPLAKPVRKRGNSNDTTLPNSSPRAGLQKPPKAPKPSKRAPSPDPDDLYKNDPSQFNDPLEDTFTKYARNQFEQNQLLLDIASSKDGSTEALRQESTYDFIESIQYISDTLQDLVRDRGLIFVPLRTMTRLDKAYIALETIIGKSGIRTGNPNEASMYGVYAKSDFKESADLWDELTPLRSQVFELWDNGNGSVSR